MYFVSYGRMIVGGRGEGDVGVVAFMLSGKVVLTVIFSGRVLLLLSGSTGVIYVILVV